jgi:hypothetical protein
MRIGRDCRAGLFKDRDRELATHGREIGQENFERISGFEVFE